MGYIVGSTIDGGFTPQIDSSKLNTVLNLVKNASQSSITERDSTGYEIMELLSATDSSDLYQSLTSYTILSNIIYGNISISGIIKYFEDDGYDVTWTNLARFLIDENVDNSYTTGFYFKAISDPFYIQYEPEDGGDTGNGNTIVIPSTGIYSYILIPAISLFDAMINIGVNITANIKGFLEGSGSFVEFSAGICLNISNGLLSLSVDGVQVLEDALNTICDGLENLINNLGSSVSNDWVTITIPSIDFFIEENSEEPLKEIDTTTQVWANADIGTNPLETYMLHAIYDAYGDNDSVFTNERYAVEKYRERISPAIVRVLSNETFADATTGTLFKNSRISAMWEDFRNENLSTEEDGIDIRNKSVLSNDRKLWHNQLLFSPTRHRRFFTKETSSNTDTLYRGIMNLNTSSQQMSVKTNLNVMLEIMNGIITNAVQISQVAEDNADTLKSDAADIIDNLSELISQSSMTATTEEEVEASSDADTILKYNIKNTLEEISKLMIEQYETMLGGVKVEIPDYSSDWSNQVLTDEEKSVFIKRFYETVVLSANSLFVDSDKSSTEITSIDEFNKRRIIYAMLCWLGVVSDTAVRNAYYSTGEEDSSETYKQKINRALFYTGFEKMFDFYADVIMFKSLMSSIIKEMMST